jgi:hypothetical protein
MNKKHIITTIVIAVVVAAAGFFGGYEYSQAKNKNAARGGVGQFVTFGQGGNRAGVQGGRRFGTGNDFLNGTVLSKDNNSITVQIRNTPGSASSTPSGSKIVILSGSTQITKAASGTAEDLTAGTGVVVTGTDNSDGSITAQTIQIRPDTPQFFRQQAPAGQ